MSFLKSILFRGKTRDLEQQLVEANERILTLEEGMERVSQAISSLSVCLTSTAIATRDLSQDMSMITTAFKAYYKLDSEGSSTWNSKNDDDGYIN